MGKIFENKLHEMTIDEIEKDILGQIEAKTGKENLPREATQQLPVLEKLTQEIKTLDEKKEKSKTEEQELGQKKDDYQKKLRLFKDKTVANIQNQLKKND